MKNLINWFEIPVADYERAIHFYETVLAVTLRREAAPDVKMAVFPYAEGATGGALCDLKGHQPGPAGPAIYLDGGDDLALPLSRVEQVGGKIVLPKTLISPEIGYMAFFEDSEGNRIGLHSIN